MTSPTTPRDDISGHETRTVHDPFLKQDVEISANLTDRLRGKYACGPIMPNGEPEFGWRQFETPPIQHEAATRLDALQAMVKELEVSNRTAKKWQQWAEDERAKYEARATSAEQERDTLSRVMEDTATELGCANDNEAILEEIARLGQERDKLSSFTQELSNALLAIRPLGGSELFVKRFGQYYADPVYCKAAIEQRIEAYHGAMKESVRNRKRAEKAEQQRDEAYERAAKVALVQARQGATAEQIAAAIRRLASGAEKEN